MNSIWQKGQDVTSKIRLQRDGDFCPTCTPSGTACLFALMKPAAILGAICGELKWQGSEGGLQPIAGGTEALSPTTSKELNPANNHVSLETNSPLFKPTGETPAPADTWSAVLGDTPKQSPQLSRDTMNYRCTVCDHLLCNNR